MHNDTVFTSNFSQPVAINRTRLGHLIALAGVLLLAVFLHFYRLEQEGYANLYYAAAVKSMLTSWHNFFFVSFDSGGFVTVDKPPLGLWIQAASAWVFGFSGWSLLLPQALAGVLSVGVLYHLVQRTFGPTAGLLAALLLTLTPISIAANRNNTMDSQLVLVVLLAAWAMMLAAEQGKLRWLLVSMFLVGVGFNIKMLQAFLVLPALYLLYFVAAPRSWWQKIWHLGVGTAVLLIVSLSWAVVVDNIPASERPFIGSSQNNTVMELITGHNGGARLFAGGPGGPGPTNGQPPNGQPPDGPPPNLPPANGNPPINNNQPGDGNNQPNNMPPGLAGGSETGDKGIGRLFNQQLAGQISWFLPFAPFSFVLVFAGGGLRWPLDAKQHQMLFWLAWLLPMVVFFSFAGLFHRYYLEMLAPAIAALTAVGLLALWQKYNQPGWQGWLLPLGIAGAAATHAFIIAAFPEWSQWLTPIVLVGGLGTAVLLLVIRYWILNPVRAPRSSLFAPILFTAALAALLLSPAIWSYTPIWFGGDTGLPYAGPELQRGRPFFTANNQNNTTTTIPGLNRELLTYLTENYQGETFLVAGSNARTVAPYILATDYAAMAMGGFSGSDNILTADSLAQLVANNEVRFFLVSEQNGPGGGPNGRGNDLTTWITNNCTAVSLQTTTPAPNNNGPRPAESPQQLFDCQS